MADAEEEQLARALAASLADQKQQRHRQVARTDEEEQLALSLALAASLADQEEQAAGVPGRGPQAHPLPQQPRPQQHYSPPQGYPPYPQQQQQQQQQWQQPQKPPQQPSTNWQQPQQQRQRPGPLPELQRHQQPQHAGRSGDGSSGSTGNTSAGGGESRDRGWSSPLKMLDSALQKVAGELGGSCCAGCGRVLGFGAYLNALGRQWHPECFKCAGCQQPLGQGSGGSTRFSVGQDGLPYHAECHKQLHHPRCYVCGDFIPERGDGRIEWREHPFPSWKKSYCPSHNVDGTPQCCSCNRLKPVSDPEWVSLQDGRLLCLECLDTLVVDTRDAQPLYDEVLQFFTYMGMRHAYKAPLLLVQGPVLEEYADKEGRPRQPGASGPVFHVRGLCVAHVYTTIPSVVRVLGGQAAVNSISTLLQSPQQHCTVSALLVMYGLPRLLIGSIIAHELMHAYLRMRNVAGLPLQVEEGLCQLMAMLWLDSQDHWARQSSNPYQQRLQSYLGWQIRTDTSDVYGEGFRIALEKFQQRGLKALVEHVIAHRSWPDWAA